MKKYEPNHFVIINTTKGQTIVVNEGIHNETIWTGKKGKKYLDSFIRNNFIIRNKPHYIKSLKDECAKRFNCAKRIKRNIGLNPPQDISNLTLISNSIFIGYIKKHILQPISIYLDFPLKYLFRPH